MGDDPAGLRKGINMLTKKNPPHHLGHRGRLKERLLQDPRSLADYEVLELLLSFANPRKDNKPLAKELLEKCGSLRDVHQARQEELLAVDGFGKGFATFWLLLREFQARVSEQAAREKVPVGDARMVAELVRGRLGVLTHEEFWVLLLDGGGRVISLERVSQGTVDQTPVYPREVLALALKRQAISVILVHNHPGGDPKPSTMDKEITRQVRLIAQGLGVKVVDHVIVTNTNYFSFKNARLM